MNDCTHTNTERHVARFTGTPSRHCLNCGTYLLGWYEEGDTDTTEHVADTLIYNLGPLELEEAHKALRTGLRDCVRFNAMNFDFYVGQLLDDDVKAYLELTDMDTVDYGLLLELIEIKA